MARKKKGEKQKADDRAVTAQEAAQSEERAAAADQVADEQAMLGRMTPLERAMLAFGLEPEHVLGSSVKDTEEGVCVTLVTQGGQKLRWPADAGRVLKQHEKDGTIPGAPAAGIFPVGK
jgi:hypothetical protein